MVNQNDEHTRRRFTIAHELGHYFLHFDAERDPGDSEKNSVIVSFRGWKNPIETEANEFAAELLMPAELLRAEYDKAFFPTASFLASKFDVSVSTMKTRLKTLELSYL
jgi:Zn-dependent peptidase ImmA (M78 family)